MRLASALLAPALGVAMAFAADVTAASVDDDDLPASLRVHLDVDDVREEGGLGELESLGPLELRGGSFGFTLRGGVAWGKTTFGPTLRWQGELLLYLPLDRLIGAFAHAAPIDPPAADDAAPTGETMPHSKTSHRRARWATLATIPGALAFGGLAAAKDKPIVGLAETSVIRAASTSVSTAPSSSASPRASCSTTTSASVQAQTAGATIERVAIAPLSSQAVRALISAAWRTAGLDGDEALVDLAARAKASALAPEMRLRAHRMLTYGARVLSADTFADRTALSDGTQTFLEARLTWRLDRLVFADEEVALERLKLERIEKRHRVGAEVVELALEWQRARRAAVDADLLPQERQEGAMRAIEAFLALDAMTGGAASTFLHGGPELP